MGGDGDVVVINTETTAAMNQGRVDWNVAEIGEAKFGDGTVR